MCIESHLKYLLKTEILLVNEEIQQKCEEFEKHFTELIKKSTENISKLKKVQANGIMLLTINVKMDFLEASIYLRFYSAQDRELIPKLKDQVIESLKQARRGCDEIEKILSQI